MRTRLSIDGMTCGACVAKVKGALTGVEGVAGVEVDLRAGVAVVEHEDGVRPEALVDAVAETGEYAARVGDAGEAGAGAGVGVGAGDGAGSGEGEAEGEKESLYPLVLIVAFLVGTVGLIEVSLGTWSWPRAMRHFMAGFFLTFSFFKLLDLRGFASTYRGYDLLARRSVAWAHAYPFVEAGLGVAYLLDVAPVLVNGVTVVVMSIGAVGVLKALLDKRRIRCACLGTALNLPMTTVTLVEDLVMAAMAAVMLLHQLG